MMTRKEYMQDSTHLHRPFYAQFVTPHILRAVEDFIGIDAIVASKDKHLNDIPLIKWDSLSCSLKGPLSVAGEIEYGPEYTGKKFYSLANGVCILKEAAWQIKETR